MKVLRVFCIIFLVIGLLLTGVFFAIKPVMQKEIDSLKDLTPKSTETEVLKSKVSYDEAKDEYTIELSGDSKKTYTLEKYEKTMNEAKDIFSTLSVGCLIFDALMVAGIVGTTIAAKKKND